MPEESGGTHHVRRQQENLQQQTQEQEVQIARLNESICTLTGSVDKLTDRIEKRIDESDRWRREQDNRVTTLEAKADQSEQNAAIIKQQEARIVALEVVLGRMEKMFWLAATGIVTTGIASGVALIGLLLQ